MKLTMHTDHALRALLYLALHPGAAVPAATIAEAYGLASGPFAQVAKRLVALGLVEARRGRGGGLRLACDPSSLRLGTLVQQLEPSTDLLECFAPETDRCAVSPACRLKHALHEAHRAFFAALDAYTLADLAKNRAALVRLLARPSRAPRAWAPTTASIE